MSVFTNPRQSLLRDIVFGLLASAVFGFGFIFYGFLIPDLLGQIEVMHFSVEGANEDVSNAFLTTIEHPGLSAFFGGLFACGWILWKGFRVIERRLRGSTVADSNRVDQREASKP